MMETLQAGLKRLKLRRIREILTSESAIQDLSGFKGPLEMVSYLIGEEVSARDETQKDQRFRSARFPSRKTLRDFDFEAQPAVNKDRIAQLASLDFLRRHENVVFLGPPGVGKSHLALALGTEAIEAGFKVRFTTAQGLTDTLYASLADGTFKRELERYGGYDLLIIDELGFLSLDRTASNHFFQVINQAYEHQSVIITSNRPFQEWAGILHDPVIVSAILDRLLHHVHLFNLKGDSYRLREQIKAQEGVAPLA